MKIKFTDKLNKSESTVVIVLDDKLALPTYANEIKNELGIDLAKVIKMHGYKPEQSKSLFIPTDSKNIKSILLFGVGDVKKLNQSKLINCGSGLYNKLKHHLLQGADIHFSEALLKDKEKLFDFLLGAFLGSYKFDKYKTVKKKDEEKEMKLEGLNVISKDASKMNSKLENYKDFAESVALVKDLVEEPANIINPITLAKACTDLKQYGVKVEVLDENKIKKLGMGALYGVAQGSATPPRVVIMHWNGGSPKGKKVALIGKGVTFDTGGLSIKPSTGMETMKGDMAGSATVIGMMRMLALRKAKVNVIGAVGLVENAVDAGAQRPGDIVTSMSGQTIEVLNTDAEGRLVLADVLWYTQANYKPDVMIDLATLTGAMRICLGDKMAGLFSNDETIAHQLFKAGQETGERTWILPLDEEYDKLIDSDIADMRNIAKPGVGAGSITAAQFLQRFVNGTKWAHIDIAAVSDQPKAPDTGLAGPTAFGMRLLNRFIADNYEG
jgi:leucyl aminopeptidase